MQVFNYADFPFEEFGEDPKRKVRLLVSPQTTGEEKCAFVVTSVPPGGISEGHTHPDSDEYIFFDIGGLVRIDGKDFTVAEKGIAHAPKGSIHECVNTSSEKELTLVCFFIPPFEPYGKYPALIEKTKRYIKEADKK